MLKCGIARIASLGGAKWVWPGGTMEQRGFGPHEKSQKECGACKLTIELCRGRVL